MNTASVGQKGGATAASGGGGGVAAASLRLATRLSLTQVPPCTTKNTGLIKDARGVFEGMTSEMARAAGISLTVVAGWPGLEQQRRERDSTSTDAAESNAAGSDAASELHRR